MKSVLIVDDSTEWCSSLKNEFQKNQVFDVLPPVHNGEKALEIITEYQPDIIILDLGRV